MTIKRSKSLRVLSVLFAFIIRTRSFNELNNYIVENEFKNLLPMGCKLPKIDAIRRH